MREPEPWEPEPSCYLEMVFGPMYWVTEQEIQQTIGPEFYMYWNADMSGVEPQRFP